MHSHSGSFASMTVRTPAPEFGLQTVAPHRRIGTRQNPLTASPPRTITFTSWRPDSPWNPPVSTPPEAKQEVHWPPGGRGHGASLRSCCYALMTGTCFFGWVPLFHPNWIFEPTKRLPQAVSPIARSAGAGRRPRRRATYWWRIRATANRVATVEYPEWRIALLFAVLRSP